VLPAELSNRAGYQPLTGFNAGFGFNAGAGSSAVPAEVRERFNADPDLRRRAAGAVEGCWTPEAEYDTPEPQAMTNLRTD
jgi:hypothetical protein